MGDNIGPLPILESNCIVFCQSNNFFNFFKNQDLGYCILFSDWTGTVSPSDQPSGGLW